MRRHLIRFYSREKTASRVCLWLGAFGLCVFATGNAIPAWQPILKWVFIGSVALDTLIILVGVVLAFTVVRAKSRTDRAKS